MQRFFFNHRRSDGGHDLDTEGMELNSLTDALDEAAYAAQTAMAYADELASGCFEIEDAGHTLVARVPYSGSPGIPEEAIEIAKLPVIPPR